MSILKNFLRVNNRCKHKFLINMGWKGLTGFRKFHRRMKRGQFFPAFQFISITNECNLRCQGCWVSVGENRKYMALETIHTIIEAGKKQGSYFFGILGGEPTMHRELTQIFSSHPDCYFQLFTNGTLLNKALAEKLRDLGNVTPLISFEGNEEIADIRRGGNHIYHKALAAVQAATQAGLITGVAVSVCKSNIEMALSDEFIEMLHQQGVLYVWYYIYRPAGSKAAHELALNGDDILRLRKFLVNGRTRLPMILIDSYWRANGEPFCPAADGLSHHINAAGHIEPCPVIQFARENVEQGDLEKTYQDAEMLRAFKTEINQKTQGCIFMEDPAWLGHFMERQAAYNTSNRPDYHQELMSGQHVPSHGSCPVIPEKSLAYRWAKKTAFLGLGAYG